MIWFFYIPQDIGKRSNLQTWKHEKQNIFEERMQGSMNLYELVAYREQFSFSKLNLLFPRTEFFVQLKPLNDRNIKK